MDFDFVQRTESLLHVPLPDLPSNIALSVKWGIIGGLWWCACVCASVSACIHVLVVVQVVVAVVEEVEQEEQKV